MHEVNYRSGGSEGQGLKGQVFTVSMYHSAQYSADTCIMQAKVTRDLPLAVQMLLNGFDHFFITLLFIAPAYSIRSGRDIIDREQQPKWTMSTVKT
jgi:hypothetical protein